MASGGMRELIPTIARTAVAAGVDGIFMEVRSLPTASTPVLALLMQQCALISPQRHASQRPSVYLGRASVQNSINNYEAAYCALGKRLHLTM